MEVQEYEGCEHRDEMGNDMTFKIGQDGWLYVTYFCGICNHEFYCYPNEKQVKEAKALGII